MKALLIDSYDHTRCCYEIAEVLVTDTVYVETDSDEYDTYEFPAVLDVTTTRGTEIYIVVPDVKEADTLTMRFFDSANVDLTSFCETTFINPDYRDVPKLEALLKEVEL